MINESCNFIGQVHVLVYNLKYFRLASLVNFWHEQGTFPWWISKCNISRIPMYYFQSYWRSKNLKIWLDQNILASNLWSGIFPDMEFALQNSIILDYFQQEVTKELYEKFILGSFWPLFFVNFRPQKNSYEKSIYLNFSCGLTHECMDKHDSQDLPYQRSKNLNKFDMVHDTMYEFSTNVLECLRSANQIMLRSYLCLCLYANEIIRPSTIYSCAICKQVKHAI